jgi:hypothetical protein
MSECIDTSKTLPALRCDHEGLKPPFQARPAIAKFTSSRRPGLRDRAPPGSIGGRRLNDWRRREE